MPAGGVQQYTVDYTPTSAAGGAQQYEVSTYPSEFAGPSVEVALSSLPFTTIWTGPSVEIALDALAIPYKVGPGVEMPLAEAQTSEGYAGPSIEEVMEFPPAVANAEAVQRDTAQTFLVDVSFDLSHPLGNDTTITVEWRRGTSGSWSAAQAQTVDRRHNVVNPITGVPVDPDDAISLNYAWNAFWDLPEGSFGDVYVRITAEGSPTSTTIVGPVTVVTTITTQEDTLAQAQARRNVLANTDDDFLGCGLIVPFRRGARDFVNSCGVDLVKSCVFLVLGIRAAVGEGDDSVMGELKWRPDLGNKLWVLKHRNHDDTLDAEAEAFVREALQWEPRVEVQEAKAEESTAADANKLRIRVRYRVISENVDSNRVFLDEFEEVISL